MYSNPNFVMHHDSIQPNAVVQYNIYISAEV